MIARELAAHLEAEGLGTVGADIFLDDIPALAGDALMIRNVPGEEPSRYLDTQYATLDVWARNANSKTAYDKLMAVQDLLHQAHHYSLGNFDIYFSHASGTIENRERDTQGRMLYKLSLRFIYHEAGS